MNGRRLGKSFKVLETNKSFDTGIVEGLINGGNQQECVAYIVRNGVSSEICERVTNNFWRLIEETGGNRVGDSYITVAQVGATQFGKTAKEYLDSSQKVRREVDGLFAGLSVNEVDSVVQERTLRNHFYQNGIAYSPSSHSGLRSNLCTARSWLDAGSFCLSPHEDVSQLTLVKDDGFEIGTVRQVVAANACISQGEGGDLVIWDIAPDESTRSDLGLSLTGYPYPLKQLANFSSLTLEIKAGDVFFLNANFIHAVTQVTSGKRITLGRFMGKTIDTKVVYWT